MYMCGFKHKILRMANTKHDQHHFNHSTLGTHQCHLQSFYHDCSRILLESTSSKVARCPNNYYFDLMDSWTVFSDGEISGMGYRKSCSSNAYTFQITLNTWTCVATSATCI